MKLEFKEGAKRERKMVPEGSHVSRLYGCIDLGTQETYYGPKRQLALLFEFPDHTHVFREEEGPQPLGRTKIVTASLNEKSILLKILQGVNGKAFTEKDKANGISIDSMIGRACLISVSHNKGKDGNMYDNIEGVTALPAGLPVKDQVNESFVYEITSGNKNWDRVPEWMKEKIKSSPEYISINGGSNETVNYEATESPF
jgi:hypothetical protein